MVTVLLAALALVALTIPAIAGGDAQVDQEQVLRGRQMVIEHGCGGCHGGFGNPAAEGWLAGMTSPAQEFVICPGGPGTEPCFRTRPRNLTPDNTTGLGRFSEQQIFNALRYGLRPGETADVEITSSVPGEGNFPMFPKYLAPPMPWPAWRHIADEDLRAIAAYLKQGLKPVAHQVEDSEGPPDFWAAAYTPENIGTYPAAPFPTAHEVRPTDDGVDMDQVLRGRQMVIEHACGDCHGGFANPTAQGWLAGIPTPDAGFPVGPCLEDPEGGAPCWIQNPRNLTPDMETGTGAYTERQIFNALRYGLRPSSTPDMEITPETFPDSPDHLGPGMPWVEMRHMADDDIRAIAAYLKHGVRPVSNEVPDSERPEEGWASEYTDEKVGSYPAPAFPTRRETGG